MNGFGSPSVVSVSRDSGHRFSKFTVDEISLVLGMGIEGDAHAGATVQHLSRVRRDPSQSNLRRGLLKAVLGHDEDGDVVRKGGVMWVVLSAGRIRPGDAIEVIAPVGAPIPLQTVSMRPLSIGPS